MKFIFSSINDISTNYVIDWLICLNQKFQRYNGVKINESEFDFNALSMHFSFGDNYDQSEIFMNSQDLLKDVDSIWFRRPYFGVDDLYNKPVEGSYVIPTFKFNQDLQSHYSILKSHTINSLLSRCNVVLGSSSIIGLNKPNALLLAKECGLNIPNTLISNSYDDVERFFENNNNKIICKALHESFAYFPQNSINGIIQFTALIDDLSDIPRTFGYSLFQELIEKMYELRIVYLDGAFYPMAIFSQGHEKTSIDFRRTDQETQVRMVPYNIEDQLKNKIDKLLKKIGLNMASIDLVKSTNGKIYFLEINPVGQYDFVSRSCNYYLDLKIANYLTHGKNK